MLIYKALESLNITVEEYEQIRVRILATDEMILHLGNSMVELIDRQKPACQGLIRLAMKDYYKRTPRYLRIDQWVSIIEDRLREHLEKIKMFDIDSIIQSLLTDVLIYQRFIVE